MALAPTETQLRASARTLERRQPQAAGTRGFSGEMRLSSQLETAPALGACLQSHTRNRAAGDTTCRATLWAVGHGMHREGLQREPPKGPWGEESERLPARRRTRRQHLAEESSSGEVVNRVEAGGDGRGRSGDELLMK